MLCIMTGVVERGSNISPNTTYRKREEGGGGREGKGGREGGGGREEEGEIAG